jgi:penicillin-binding protein 1B
VRRSGFIISSLLGGVLAAMLGIGIFIWSVDREWSPVLKARIEEERSRASIRVQVRSPENGELQWLGTLSAGRLEDRKPVRLAEIPPLLIQSIVTLEDPRFLSHDGFDGLGILRAFWANLRSLRYAQGGSTITQQLVKNVLLSNEKTIRRKLTEIVLAAIVEKNFTKDQILETYLNEVYLGQIGPVAVHGVARGASYYFNKELSELDLHEMALLAALVKGPGFYSPWKFPERALARRNLVLGKLFDSSLILKEEFDNAVVQALPSQVPSSLASIKAPYVMDALRKKLLDERGEAALLSQAFDVVLTLDSRLQESAERILRERAGQWEVAQQAILFAARPSDCKILAYVGGTQYSLTQLDHIRQMERPIGSLIKPLLISDLLDQGAVNLASVLEDQPLKWSFDSGRGNWEPQNYDRRFRGKVTLRRTLEDSLNVPLVRIFFEHNPSGLLWENLNSLRALGLKTPEDRALPSSLLGALEQSPWKVMEAYLKLTRRALGLAQDAGDLGCALDFQENDPPAVAPEPTEFKYGQVGARLTLAALEGAVRRGTSASLGSQLPKDQSWAGKTGTSSDQKDSWYVLLSPNFVMLSWVGRDDNLPTKFTGATGALPLITQWLKDFHQTQAPQAWSWPEVEQIQWKAVDTQAHCVLEATFSSGELRSSTPPPEPIDLGGKSIVWEMFKENSFPEPCPL